MFAFEVVLLIAIPVHVLAQHTIQVANRCSQNVDVGIRNGKGKSVISNGGFRLAPGMMKVLAVPPAWAGKFWGRTGCDASGKCETGSCVMGLECGGGSGIPPFTLAEFTFEGFGDLDFYDISLVKGFNLPIAMQPLGGFTSDGGQFSCKVAACRAKINDECPSELQKNVGARTVGCRSACGAFNTDQYCCRGNYNRPATCKSTDWPVDYAKFFKNRCPDAYSYVFDDNKSTFTCKAMAYRIVFCG